MWFCPKLVWKKITKSHAEQRCIFCRSFYPKHSCSWFDWNYPKYIQQMLFLSSQNSPPTLLAFTGWFNTQTIIMWLIIYCTVSACGADWRYLVCLKVLIVPGSRYRGPSSASEILPWPCDYMKISRENELKIEKVSIQFVTYLFL